MKITKSTKKFLSEIGRKGGSSKSPKKQESSRRNGFQKGVPQPWHKKNGEGQCGKAQNI